MAAAQIYNMLKEHKGTVTVKVDGIAASAASVIAMAGSKVLMSPVSMIMIHNPITFVYGDAGDFDKAKAMLEEVKESIINAYEVKTGLSRTKLAHLMDNETWMNANKALELGFADEITSRDSYLDLGVPDNLSSFSQVKVVNSLMEKISAKSKIEKKEAVKKVKANSLMDRLFLIKNWR